MNVFLLVVIYSFSVGVLYADFGIVEQTPTQHVAVNMTQVSIQINQTVNQPTFQTYIHFYYSNTTSISNLDASNNASNITYTDARLTFPIPKLNIDDTFYITFDAGVFYSNNVTNSSSRIDANFWQLQVTSSDPTTTTTTTTSTTASTETTTATIDTTTTTTTTTDSTTTVTTANTTTTTTISTTTTNTAYAPGEPSPTRSAQVGMGLGITFITIVIISEVVYFKYCYNGAGRSTSYFT